MRKGNATHMAITFSQQQLKVLDDAVAMHEHITSRGGFVEAAMDGLVAALPFSSEPQMLRGVSRSLWMDESKVRSIKREAQESGVTQSSIVRRTVFGRAECVRKRDAETLDFLDLELRDYENDAVKQTLRAYPHLGSFGGLVSALRAGDSIDVVSPVPNQTWKTKNGRIYLRQSELGRLGDDREVSGMTNNRFMLTLLFGADYQRVRKQSLRRKS